jgi:hypothetical protein
MIASNWPLFEIFTATYVADSISPLGFPDTFAILKNYSKIFLPPSKKPFSIFHPYDECPVY